MKSILIIDNYDSFVYNLYQYIGELAPDAAISVYRNDALTLEAIREMHPSHIIISPGPGRPQHSGICPALVEEFFKKIPILGVCLGHQVIGMVFGGNVIHAKSIVHGKASSVQHTETGLFTHITNPFTAGRYHSLAVEKKTLPRCLRITAQTQDEEIMALQHVNYPTFGVQFHPESVLTPQGKDILANFLSFDHRKKSRRRKTQQAVLKPNAIVAGLAGVLSRKNLSQEQMRQIMKEVMSGAATDAQIAGFLAALRMKGETGDELAGMAKVMQEKSLCVRTFHPQTADTCGTGGDGAKTFNISTAAAFVVSAGGIPIAKHGNRSVSSMVGSADVLEAGGYVLQKTTDELADELKELAFAFLFAPLLHPAMKNVMPARRQLKTRTAFNLLGPLTNPARVKYQIIGLFDYSYASKVAVALRAIGTKKSLVVSGGFTDELTTCGDNRALLVAQGRIQHIPIRLKSLGLRRGKRNDIAGQEDPHRAFQILQDILRGKASRTQTETVALNAGVVLWITGKAKTLSDGVSHALAIITSGQGYDKLHQVITYQRERYLQKSA